MLCQIVIFWLRKRVHVLVSLCSYKVLPVASGYLDQDWLYWCNCKVEMLFLSCRGSLYRLIHRPNNQLDARRCLRMALDVV